MDYQYDANADCAYVLINRLPYSYSKEIDETRFVDYAEDGTVIGIELLYVSGSVDIYDLPCQSEVGELLEKHHVRVFLCC